MSKKSKPVNRKQVDRQEKAPSVLLGEGEISIEDRSLVTRLLGHFGIDATFVKKDVYESRQRELSTVVKTIEVTKDEAERPFKFASITSPGQFLVKEHFDDYKKSMHPEINGGLMGRLFRVFVDGNTPSNRGRGVPLSEWHNGQQVYREPNPLDGIVITRREDLGIEPYKRRSRYDDLQGLAIYAVQAGSIVKVAEAFENKVLLTWQQQLTLSMAHQLKTQFGS